MDEWEWEIYVLVYNILVNNVTIANPHKAGDRR